MKIPVKKCSLVYVLSIFLLVSGTLVVPLQAAGNIRDGCKAISIAKCTASNNGCSKKETDANGDEKKYTTGCIVATIDVPKKGGGTTKKKVCACDESNWKEFDPVAVNNTGDNNTNDTPSDVLGLTNNGE